MEDPFKAPGDDTFEKMPGSTSGLADSTTKATDSLLVKSKGGGLGAAAQKTVEERKQTNLPPETPPEPYDFPTIEEEAAEDTAKADTTVLSDPKWSEPDTLFHQETEVSVQVATPPGKEYITKVQAELFAKTPSGPEPISKGEGHAQPDGRAKITLPVYKPKGHKDGLVEYFVEFTHKLAKVLSAENLLRKVTETALKSADHELVPGITFERNTGFISPKASTGLKPFETRFQEWNKKYPKGHIVLFGHTDKDEPDGKGLSERRAQSALAFITNDAASWENLYSTEKWGLKSLQDLLKDLGHYAGTVDGHDGPKTQAAFKSFQKGADLPESGKEDAGTRKALFSAYMKGKHDIKIEASRFSKVAGHPWMGCGQINHVKSAPAAENRRVTFILINPSKYFPVYFPCQDGNDSACKSQCRKEGKRSSPGIKCLFYDELVREKPQEAVKAPEKPAEPLEDGQKIIDAARRWIGAPYLTGGNSKEGADCSGSICGIFADAKMPFPRVSSYDFPALEEFEKVSGNVPQNGDVGYWPGHLMIFDSNAGTTSKGEAANGWSATHPGGKAFGVARYQWFDDHYKVPVVWYRYLKKKDP